jgi:dihydroxyacetone kinase
MSDRRGIAGDILAVKIGGAVTSAGLSLTSASGSL